MNLAIFSSHKDICDYTNRYLINSTIYVSSFNCKNKKKINIFTVKQNRFNKAAVQAKKLID